MSGERVEDHADILAAHYTTALDLARAAHGQDTSELEDKALRYLVLAGDRAMGIDVEAAERHYARALLLTEKGHPDRPRVLARTGEALRLRGRFPEAALAYEEAIEGLRAQGDVRAMGIAMGHHRMVRLRLGDPRSKEVGAQAVAALEPLGPSAELAQALTELAGQCFQLSEFREAIVFADRAIALAKELGLPEQARALGFRGAALAWLGDADGVQVMRRALDVAAEQGRSRDVALLYNNIDVALWPIEGSVAWLEAAREGAAFAEQRGFEDLALTFASSTVLALIDLGSYEEAMALAADLVPRLEAANDVWELVQVRSAQVRVITRLGNQAEGTRLADWVVEKARDSAHAPLLAQAFPAAAALRLAVGETAGALALLDELERTLYVRTESNHAANLPSAVRTALGRRRPGPRSAPRREPGPHLPPPRACPCHRLGPASRAPRLISRSCRALRRLRPALGRVRGALGAGPSPSRSGTVPPGAGENVAGRRTPPGGLRDVRCGRSEAGDRRDGRLARTGHGAHLVGERPVRATLRRRPWREGTARRD